ncbi:4-(cytidine 5'-diphospho)-2-C-methyl-D-erythritol kinase [Deminuibacter soli]|uniref:4-diphosphocytidyl-2-C-methyl-D-erythritol kinase n=1 Tax=Deminuibacter soli TaxID=2291815 RepID=A0A3E1NI32_9BACT|nr:4-(cytidine 5'-diphospho)-2-C-methyl-D-erythritol kinase [Deminuibacter soli]RFM27593.1 4-(cytidine 5'-diphospho)-2-C-methyl-D-erythritol kinase [Deminuibacter soli]
MVVFPNCKINLGLHITRKREDGFHDLETVFYPLPLRDALEVINSPLRGAQFSSTGLPIAGDPAGNLCVKAYHLLKQDYPQLPGVQIHLQKSIPMGAGLGGGSADGAFTLQLLNRKYQLGISEEQLMHYALQLGSDCPFFIINKPAYAAGRGEKLQPVNLDLSAYTFVVINPGIHVSTGQAFSLITPQPAPVTLSTIIQQPVQSWRGVLTNDFEAPVMQLHPELLTLKKQLYNAGAIYAAMSGSGSTFFGIFEKKSEIKISTPSHYLTLTI